MKKKWQIYETDQGKVNKIELRYKINKILATIIANRNIPENDIETFLNPTRNNFHDPFQMPDMEVAVNRI